jgi:fructose-1-phosphate kinase PfkB-like protein
VLDAHGEALLGGTAACPAIVKPNLGEREALAGRSLPTAGGRPPWAGAFNVIGIDHAEAVEPTLRPSARP